MNLSDLQREHKLWADYNFPNRKPHMPVLGVAEEAGELAHSALKLEQGIRGSEAEHRAKMADSIGDIIIFLSDVSNQWGFDLESCVDDAWQQVKQRDWQRDAKNGNGV